jgi:hypothetical protein
MPLTGNKGEWSEIYVFLKLLADTKLFTGDKELNKLEEHFYPIIKILRSESDGNFEYQINNDIVFVFGGEEEIRIPVNQFQIIAERLFKYIKDSNGTLAFPDIESFMNSIHCYSLKAKSQDKADIKIIIHDLRTGMQPLLGFSIKSRLGSASTLINASSDNTNFKYSISKIDSDFVLKFNTLSNFSQKFELLNSIKAEIEFVSTVSPLMNSNLIYVDYILPDILGQVVLQYYSSKNSKISDIIALLDEKNPLGFNFEYGQDFYAHKIKRYLTDSALGMRTASPWLGQYEATGGYIIVKEDGELICYHIYDKNQFEDYLFYNTRLDTPSTSRHGFGNIYEENGKFYLKLNLQVRFL